MECTYCEAELEKEDEYGFFCAHQSGEKMGDILRCPNHEGFETETEAREYDTEFPKDQDWKEICCDSACHHVSGSFYTDEFGKLLEGYPC